MYNNPLGGIAPIQIQEQWFKLHKGNADLTVAREPLHICACVYVRGYDIKSTCLQTTHNGTNKRHFSQFIRCFCCCCEQKGPKIIISMGKFELKLCLYVLCAVEMSSDLVAHQSNCLCVLRSVYAMSSTTS